MKNRVVRTGKKLPESIEASPENVVSIQVQGSETAEQKTREIVFRSAAMESLCTVARHVAGSDASVLIFGESGTGKELFARLIHNLSGRSSRPFVPVNCGILHGELFVDKFFGHESGAFTGAKRQRKGAFEMAEAGTLFLDEVGEIPLPSQSDFLRVLEERHFRRMGGEKEIPFQARIVSATNRPLLQMVQEGSFRADLFYRLNVVPVYLPPLRERVADISPLTEHFLSFFKHLYHKPNLLFHADVITLFEEYAWPGNVRELRNLIERLVLLCHRSVIYVDDLPIEVLIDSGNMGSTQGLPLEPEVVDSPVNLRLATAVKEAEIRAILKAFKHAAGHKGKTAKLLDISERSLRYKLTEYQLKL